ncbi:MAG: hypothetical protein IJ439_02315 [Tyzzerella sp.]|nr:hypothetical protein [Tyzzerella sp.]
MKLVLFYNILNMSLKASFVILAVLLIRLCLKKAPKIFSYVLWIVVLFRLLCPVSIELPFSVIPEDVNNGIVMKGITEHYVGNRKIYEDTTEEFDTAIKHGLEPVVELDESGEIGEAYVVTAEDGISEPDTIYKTWLPILSNLWIVGIVGLLLYNVISFLKLKKKLIGSVPYDEEEDIYISDYIDMPFVIGFYYPSIYLPSSLGKKEQEYILLHERYHIRRKDNIIKVLAFFALCIHWFNPLVWIAFILFTKDMEMGCDEAVLKEMGEEIREDYATSLLSLATGKRALVSTALAFGEGDTKGRIINALSWKKPATKVVASMAVLCVLVGTVCFANPADNAIENPYEWTSKVSLEDIDSCSAASLGDDTVAYEVPEEILADFIYVLNEIPRGSIRKEKTASEKQITVAFTCGKQEFLLTYGNGITMFSFDKKTKLLFEEEVWQTDDKQLASCMKRLISQGTSTVVSDGPVAPTRDEVYAMREKVQEGMTEEEISRLRELVKVENLNRESSYLYGNQFEEYKNPESKYWDCYTQSGKIQVGWAVTCKAPGFDPNGDMTEEEYYQKYGVPEIVEVDVPKAEVFYSRINEFRSLVKSDLLDYDFDVMEECMRLAVETHDVNYLYQIYYMLHDMDYFLFRYGPESMGLYVSDMSTVEKYYGVLNIYEGEPK